MDREGIPINPIVLYREADPAQMAAAPETRELRDDLEGYRYLMVCSGLGVAAAAGGGTVAVAIESVKVDHADIVPAILYSAGLSATISLVLVGVAYRQLRRNLQAIRHIRDQAIEDELR